MSSPPAINHAVILATTLAVLLSLTSLTSLSSTAFAQGNQTTATTASSSSNQTGAQVTGQPETTVLNETTIPAQQTNVTVNQTAEPVSPQALQPLENLTQSQSAANLSGFEKLTMQHLHNHQLAVLEEEETKHSNSNNNKLVMQRHSRQPEVEAEEEHKKK